MYFACRHIKTDGTRCQAPAMRTGHFCYFHSKNRSAARLKPTEDLVIPIAEDHASIRTSIAQTLNALIAKSIDAKTAGLVLYGLQLAAQSIPKALSLAPDSVLEIKQSTEGEELAPGECIDPRYQDCAECALVETCKDRELDPEEDEDDEEEEVQGQGWPNDEYLTRAWKQNEAENGHSPSIDAVGARTQGSETQGAMP